jgi:hypothetical protein
MARSELPTPRIISDKLDDVWNPVNGKKYDSKSAYYNAVKDAGYTIAGNDSSITAPKPVETTAPKGLKDDLKAAWEQNT